MGDSLSTRNLRGTTVRVLTRVAACNGTRFRPGDVAIVAADYGAYVSLHDPRQHPHAQVLFLDFDGCPRASIAQGEEG